MDSIKTQCVIAGGGPAGIMLGYLLARARIDVHVLEKWPDFFRDFRGDTIHPSTMEALYELGLLEKFLQLRHDTTRKMNISVGGQAVTIADFSKLRTRCPFIAFIPQWDFLNFIVSEAAKYPHFHLHMQTEAVDIIEENDRVNSIIAQNKEAKFEIRAELVVGADGRHSVIREKAKLQVVQSGAPIDVLWFRIPMQEKDPEQSFGLIGHGAIAVLIDRSDYWQCAFIIPKDGFEKIKSAGIESFRQTLTKLSPKLKDSVQQIKNFQELKLLSVTVDHLQTWHRDGLVCIGDAAHAMSPIGGVGINLAIQDAIAAANILIPQFKDGRPSMESLAKIQRRRTMPTYWTQRLQILMHEKILLPYLRETRPLRLPLFMRILNTAPFLQRIPARLVGIGFRPEHIEFK